MTNMGLQYLQHQETVRANKAKEAETKRHNRALINQAMAELMEKRRSNVSNESLTQQRNAETQRYNTLQYGLGLQSLDEQTRSNLAREFETNRSNIARENETHRANVQREDIDRDVNNIKRQQNKETKRHNLETESQGRETNKIRWVDTISEAFRDAAIGWEKIGPKFTSLINGDAFY